jgi:ribokinase
VDAVPAEGESVLGRGFDEPWDGGKGSNQAVAAARLGAPTVLVAVLGSDERGRRWRAFFEREGIETRWCFEVDGPTDVGFVLLPPSKVPAIASAMERNGELTRHVAAAEPAIASASVVVSQLETPQDAALAAFRIARQAGALTVLNPSPAASLDPEFVALTDVLVPNEHEAAALGGSRGGPADLAAALAARVPAVIVTAGEAGAFLAADGQVEHIRAPEVEVVDTTGAGDAFIGALAVRLREGAALREAVAFAVGAATLSVTRPGSMPSYPTAAELSSPTA